MSEQKSEHEKRVERYSGFSKMELDAEVHRIKNIPNARTNIACLERIVALMEVYETKGIQSPFGNAPSRSKSNASSKPDANTGLKSKPTTNSSSNYKVATASSTSLSPERKKIEIIILMALIILAVTIFITRPMMLVGRSTMIASLLIWVTFFLSLMRLVHIFFSGSESKDKIQKNLTLVLIFIAAGGGIPGVIFMSISFDKVKAVHLQKHGEITVATITDKTARSVVRRGRQNTGYELSYNYTTHKGDDVVGWEVVSENEFRPVQKGSEVLLVYSSNHNTVRQLLITAEFKEKYKDKITQYLNQSQQ